VLDKFSAKYGHENFDLSQVQAAQNVNRDVIKYD